MTLKLLSTRWRKPLPIAALTATAVLLGGCRPSLPPPKPLTELTPQESSGRQVYESNCARCHFPNSENGFHGPGLQGLYKKPYLPSGAPANDDRVTTAIIRGRGIMPAFGGRLDEQRLADLVAYLHTL